MDAKGFLGLPYLGLGLLYRAKRKTEQARTYLLKATNIFHDCDAKIYLKQANEALESLE